MEETTATLDLPRTDTRTGMSPETFTRQPETVTLRIPEKTRNEYEFEGIINKGINVALGIVRRDFEEVDDPAEKLPFHNSLHTLNVVNRTQAILEEIYLEDPSLLLYRDIQLGKLAAAFHDTAQVQTTPDANGNGIQRKRIPQLCEEGSVELALQFMHEVNKEHPGTFTENDEATIREAIMATVPGWDNEHTTVIQPQVSSSSSIITQALALADINTVGLGELGTMLHETNSYFKENNLDITYKIRDGEVFTASELEALKQRLSSWYDVQLGFIKGRSQLFEKEIRNLPNDHARTAVRRVFSGFEPEAFQKTYNRMEELYSERKQLNPEALLEAAGYHVIPTNGGYRLHL